MTDTPSSPWWGRTDLAVDAAGLWQVGPLRFWLARTDSEWRFGCERTDDPLAESSAREIPAPGGFPEDAAEMRRLGFRRTSGAVRLTPRLADRPVVVTPSIPFSLPPQEELTIYVSTALWLEIAVGEPAVAFLETPLYRPSDTWFGPSTMEGELCYAVRTSARLQLDNLPVRPHRAVSAVRVCNRAPVPLDVERIRLPLPQMSLFAGADGQLWTETVTLERTQAGEHAAIELGRKPPARIQEPKQVSGPREHLERGLLIRAFGGLIGGGR